jgi:O-succinylbenzoate synthase
LVYGDRALAERRGLCLRLESQEGTFYSEASPLPGHSWETLEAVEEALRVSTTKALLEEPSNSLFPPSLRFGLEGLVLQKERAWKNPVRAAALVPWLGPEKTTAAIRGMAKRGFHTVKLKLFSHTVEETLETMRQFPETLFRLDANRALTEEALRSLFRGIEKGGVQVEYLEEPLSHWRHELLKNPPIPLAADECAADPQFWGALLRAGGPAVFVLKPTVCGGLLSLARKAERLKEAGKKIVYSSSLEAEPGLRSLIHFLSLEAETDTGLATSFLFEKPYFEDLPVRDRPPQPSTEELAWLETLDWRRIP